MILHELRIEFENSIHTNWTREEIVDLIQKKIDFINGSDFQQKENKDG